MLSLVRSLWEVFRHAFAKRVTIQYPDEKPYLAPRYRGRIVLSRDPDCGERCVACNLCAVACPVDCISLQATEDEHGRRYPSSSALIFRVASSAASVKKHVLRTPFNLHRISKWANTNARILSTRKLT